MTILKASACFSGYRHRAIDPSLVTQLCAPLPEKHTLAVGRALLRLECYLQITNQTLNSADLADKVASPILEGFMGALYAGALGKGTLPATSSSMLKLAMAAAYPQLQLPAHTTTARLTEELATLAARFRATELNLERVAFWAGWSGQSLAGKTAHLRLWEYHELYGSTATQMLANAVLGWWSSNRADGLPPIQALIDEACRRTPAVDFQDPISLGAFLQDFFKSWLRSRGEKERRTRTSVVIWHKLVVLMESQLFDQVWASPLPAVPHPKAKTTSGTACRITISEEGTEVKESLLTPVPLEISDDQAFNLLFRDIQHDHDVVQKWAMAEIELAQSRVIDRRRLSCQGYAYTFKKPPSEPGPSKEERLSRDSPSYLAHAASTLHAYGLDHIGDECRTSVMYPRPYALITWELALPMPALMLAHGAVLVDEHPQLTPALLAEFNLYDSKGRKTGLKKVDGAWVLTGFKVRSGPPDAQKDIVLTERSLWVIHCIEDLTQHTRSWLKARNDDTWRRLFIAIATIGRPPKAWSPSTEAHRHVHWLAARIEELSGTTPEHSRRLAKRFSLRRVRASKAVLVYIESSSLEKMSKALGHKDCTQSLLDFYLPKVIQDFFMERWIRLFQTGIICEAMKDSPFLLNASSFSSIDQLENFLDEHMLRRVPAHMNRPATPTTGEESSQLVFGLSEENLTVLRSIELAVIESPRQANARSRRWAKVSERLFPHLETQCEQPDLKRMARSAIARANSALVQDAVRE